jgi:hypothetical protein
LANIQSYPPYQRALLRGFLDVANGPTNIANVGPVLDAKYAAFAANGLAAYGVTEPGAAGLKGWIGTMRASLLSAISSAGMSSVPFVGNECGAILPLAKLGPTRPTNEPLTGKLRNRTVNAEE